MPESLLIYFEQLKNKPLNETIQESRYSKSMKCEGNKLRITPALFEDFFSAACIGIIEHLRDLLEKPKVGGTDMVLMVGGFSESQILQTYIKSNLPNFRIVIPNEPLLAI